MEPKSAIEDILVLAFLREGLAIRNRGLEELQKKVVMSLLAHRHNAIARRKAYRTFIQLERGLSKDYQEPTFKYMYSLHQGEVYLTNQTAELEYGRRHPRFAQKVFHYLKSRMIKGRTRS